MGGSWGSGVLDVDGETGCPVVVGTVGCVGGCPVVVGEVILGILMLEDTVGARITEILWRFIFVLHTVTLGRKYGTHIDFAFHH